MPGKNTFTDSGLGVISSFSGTLESDVFLQILKSRYSSEDTVRKLRYVITDHTAVEKFNISTEDIIKAVEISTAASKINTKICIASVTPNDLAYGLLRMWGSYADLLPWEYKNFKSISDAKNWLSTEIGLQLTFTE